MRRLLVVCVAACVSACAGGSVAPSEISSGTTTNIAGTWNGTIVSSNNPTVQLKIVLTQSGSSITGTWDSSSVSWAGQVSGSVSGSSLTAQFTFSGTASDGTVCTGTASATGPVTATTMSLTSTSGVVGASCPAPLPIGLKIDVQRQ
jgi:hypothetical protein